MTEGPRHVWVDAPPSSLSSSGVVSGTPAPASRPPTASDTVPAAASATVAPSELPGVRAGAATRPAWTHAGRRGGPFGLWLTLGALGLVGVGAVAFAIASEAVTWLPRDADVLTMYAAEEGVVGEAMYVREGADTATDRAAHDALWEQWSAMIPPYWARRVEVFEVSSDGAGGVAAAVQRRDDRGERWLLSVDPIDAAERPDLYDGTLVHELAHIVTLGDGRVAVRPGNVPLAQRGLDCGGPAVREGCAEAGSVLARFITTFWDADAVAAADAISLAPDFEAAVLARYADERDAFVTPYAASDPGEDIAETFVAMVEGQRLPAGSIAAQKVEMLRADPELFSLADRIRVALRSR